MNVLASAEISYNRISLSEISVLRDARIVYAERDVTKQSNFERCDRSLRSDNVSVGTMRCRNLILYTCFCNIIRTEREVRACSRNEDVFVLLKITFSRLQLAFEKI